ncbi:hypothetical protein WJX72_000547 [[Myrmecia] bisecta]|uniref:50S ribosomal protein L35 n=1 Tax=[Myrmecia] bisecta TaxID=41462 RepID=A0AAW1PZJ8_9CHLO
MSASPCAHHPHTGFVKHLQQPLVSLSQCLSSPSGNLALQQPAYSTQAALPAQDGLWYARRVLHGCRRTASIQGNSIWTPQHRCKSTLKPRFTGGKLKPYTAYKERFKLTATGLVRYFRSGHRHRRFIKSNKQRRGLKKSAIMHDAYATTMKRLGFKMTSY